MLMKPEVLAAAGIVITGNPADGDYMDMDAVDISTIHPKLVSAAKSKAGFSEVYAFAGPERFYDDPAHLSGASTQLLYSEGLGMAAILYLDPALSDGFLSWVAADSVDEAIAKWSEEVHAGGVTTVIAETVPDQYRSIN